ncbi:MAG: DUF2332 domain-containing protein [Actinomycetota bacterium]|nr:DUF2332 domain-containing protein [Actinomycetota bacterium]
MLNLAAANGGLTTSENCPVRADRQRSSRPFGGARDARLGQVPLSERFARLADALERGGRSPLYVTIMRAAAQDIDRGGEVAELFDALPVPPGSVPSLRLLAALHYLVLAGAAPALAEFYPSVGGDRMPETVWPAVLDALSEHAGVVRQRLTRTVQTNEPGRAAVLFGAMLWLTNRYRLPIRLLEIGASAGLNLLADRFCYLQGGVVLGDPASPVRFTDPWAPAPGIDLASAARTLRIVERGGCDPNPLDSRKREDCLAVLSYVWPDESARTSRTQAALELAAEDPPQIAAQPAEEWLPGKLAQGADGELTVLWQSIVRQYIEPRRWEAIELAFDRALRAREPSHPLVWLRMEPSDDHLVDMQVTLITHPGRSPIQLARCGDHGPPVAWDR